MRKRGRVDTNQPEIVAALRSVGCSVLSMANLGNGAPDILVAREDVLYLMEIKFGKEGLTPHESDFHARWGSPIYIVRSVDDALRVVGCEVE